MSIEIKVAPQGITISQGRTFMVTDERGEINPPSGERAAQQELVQAWMILSVLSNRKEELF